jgi:hypothetical protein
MWRSLIGDHTLCIVPSTVNPRAPSGLIVGRIEVELNRIRPSRGHSRKPLLARVVAHRRPVFTAGISARSRTCPLMVVPLRDQGRRLAPALRTARLPATDHGDRQFVKVLGLVPEHGIKGIEKAYAEALGAGFANGDVMAMLARLLDEEIAQIEPARCTSSKLVTS